METRGVEETGLCLVAGETVLCRGKRRVSEQELE